MNILPIFATNQKTMKTDFILELLRYTIPALTTAALSYVYFSKILERQSKKDLYLLKQLKEKEETKKTIDTTALKLQACERLIILVERIDLKKLVLRINPVSEDNNTYQFALIQHIEQEFDYNISQQLYVTNELWQIITQTKNTIISTIHQTANHPSVVTANALREVLLKENIQLQRKTEIALSAIKLEADSLL